MATSVPRNIYPFSTQNGQAIPLDIIKPSSVSWHGIAPDALAILPTLLDHEVLVLYSTTDTLISFTGAGFTLPLSQATAYSDTLFLPAFTILTVESVAGTGKAVATAAVGVLYIQKVDKWAALAFPRQAITR